MLSRMPIVPLSTLADPRLAGYREISEPELVRDRGLFVAEGRLVVERVLRQGFTIRSLLLNAAAHAALAPLLSALERETPVYVADASEFQRLTGHDFHRGCLALVERPKPRPLVPLLEAARTLVVLEGVANPDNVGGVFRNAAAFGVDAVLLSPTTTDPLYRKAIRTSMAQTLRVPFARIGGEPGQPPWPDALSLLAERGFQLVALTPREPSLDIDAFARTQRSARTALLVGTEGAGLSEAVEVRAEQRVRIPIRRDVDSLNLAVAVGIALHRLAEQRE
jgi:tRNA G18 (ribose-2'-O)-methylase SpoU